MEQACYAAVEEQARINTRKLLGEVQVAKLHSEQVCAPSATRFVARASSPTAGYAQHSYPLAFVRCCACGL
jgi:hypothetical protein